MMKSMSEIDVPNYGTVSTGNERLMQIWDELEKEDAIESGKRDNFIIFFAKKSPWKVTILTFLIVISATACVIALSPNPSTKPSVGVADSGRISAEYSYAFNLDPTQPEGFET